MKRNQVWLFAGVCGLLLGACNLLSSVAYVLLPAAQKLGSPGTALLPSVAQSATVLILLHLGFTAIGLLGLGLVPGLTGLVRTPGNEGWLGWASNLATVGYAVFAVAGLLTIDHVPRVAQAYVGADAATQAALLPLWRGSLDPFAFWGYGVVGFLILLSSLAGLLVPRPGTLRLMSVLGILVGLLQMLIPLGFVFKLALLFTIVNILGALGVTLWYVWAGLVLWRASSQAPATAAR